MLTIICRAPWTLPVIVGIVLMGCNGDDEPPIAPAGKMIAKIEGTPFEGDGGVGILGEKIRIGASTEHEYISISITKAADVGTYDVKGAAPGVIPDAYINYNFEGYHNYSSILAGNNVRVGTVTITERDNIDKTVSGTFSGTTIGSDTGSKKITDGSFTKIPYIILAGGSLAAKIEGEAYTSPFASGRGGFGLINIMSSSLVGTKSLTINVADDITPGIYNMGAYGFPPYGTWGDGSEAFVSSTGTITVTKHDQDANWIEGTFSFVADPLESGYSVSITEGTFAVNYSLQ